MEVREKLNANQRGTIRGLKRYLKMLLRSHKFVFYYISAPKPVDEKPGIYSIFIDGVVYESSVEGEEYEENTRMCERFFETREEQRRNRKCKN